MVALRLCRRAVACVATGIIDALRMAPLKSQSYTSAAAPAIQHNATCLSHSWAYRFGSINHSAGRPIQAVLYTPIGLYTPRTQSSVYKWHTYRCRALSHALIQVADGAQSDSEVKSRWLGVTVTNMNEAADWPNVVAS